MRQAESLDISSQLSIDDRLKDYIDKAEVAVNETPESEQALLNERPSKRDEEVIEVNANNIDDDVLNDIVNDVMEVIVKDVLDEAIDTMQQEAE